MVLFLDKDPILCAKATPYESIRQTINDIVAGYELSCKSPEEVDKEELPFPDETASLICSDIRKGEYTCLWYSRFLQSLKILEGCVTGGFIDTPCIDSKKVHYNNIILPAYMPFLHNPIHNSRYARFTDDLEKSSDAITVSRAILTLMQPEFEDFVMGQPEWLKFSSKEVLSAYDEENRRHIRIETNGKRYRYYTSIISDNFKEVTGVPEEMDKIVNYLMSNRPNLALVNRR